MICMFRYLTSVLLWLLLICSLPACKETGLTSAKKSPHHENILRYDVNASFTSLNPTEVYASGSNHLFPLLYSYLFVPNSNGELEPDLATKWTYDPENCTWTIRLRKDALFHNNQPVTSGDVKYALEAHLADIDTSIESISPVSDGELRIRLKKNDAEFPKKIWNFDIIPRSNGEDIDYWNHPIGSGPFKFSHRNGQKEVVFVANEDYYEGRPSLDRVIFYYQPNKEESWARLLSGQTDIAQEISPKNYMMMRQYEKKYYFNLYTMNSHYTILLYNTTHPLFSDPNVRVALSHAIDKEHIVEKILDGCGVVASSPMGIISPYHNPKVNPIPYNPRKALKLLNEAGWSYDEDGGYLNKEGESFAFPILVHKESQIEKKVAQYIKLSLNDLGMKVRLQFLPLRVLRKKYFRNNQFQAVVTELNTVGHVPEVLKSIWCTYLGKKSEAGCFDHPKVTSLIRKAFDEKDLSKRKDLFYEIDALITSLQPGTFLFQKTAIDVMSKRFTITHPFSLTYQGIYRLKYAALNQN